MRLLGAIKLWGDIRFFDPQVSEGSVDWDAAFMNAEPSIMAAATPDAYAAAIASLLSPLHDPATYVDGNGVDSYARMTISQSGSASVITIEHATSETADAFQKDATRAVSIASKSPEIVFDLRGDSESNAADAAALQFFASPESLIVGLLSGDVLLPRERARSYLGYPNETAFGYQGYSAADFTPDRFVIGGKSKQSIRFGFVVDQSTSLPPLAIALASAGKATIYSSGGQPAVLSPGSQPLHLPEGIIANYRTGDLADIAERQPFASAVASDPAAAVAKLTAQPPEPTAYASAPPEKFTNSAYADEAFPPEPMRMLAIARIYNVVRYFSPYRDLMHDDWDAAALQAIRDERAAAESRSYLLGLMKFYAHLHDSHGYYFNGKLVYAEFGAGVPFGARYLHGQAVVTQLFADAPRLQGLRIGDVITAVDGVPIRQAMDRIQAYICASTQQAADNDALSSAYEPSVFSGKRGTTIALRFHHPHGGGSTTTTFLRDVVTIKPGRWGPKFFVLPGNVGYVNFDQLAPAEVNAMFEALKKTRAIIFDNRGYPKGAAWSIAPRLTTATSLRFALFNTPFVIEPTDDPQGDALALPTYHQFYQMMDPADGPRYLKPTVMLIDDRAISQSEHSALFFRVAGHTRFVGTPTRGANGDVTRMIAPGGVGLLFSGEGVRWPDGRQLQRVGIIPDVRVEPTASDIATGNDVVLQRGLAEALRLTGASQAARATAVRQEIARERALSGLP